MPHKFAIIKDSLKVIVVHVPHFSLAMNIAIYKWAMLCRAIMIIKSPMLGHVICKAAKEYLILPLARNRLPLHYSRAMSLALDIVAHEIMTRRIILRIHSDALALWPEISHFPLDSPTLIFYCLEL